MASAKIKNKTLLGKKHLTSLTRVMNCVLSVKNKLVVCIEELQKGDKCTLLEVILIENHRTALITNVFVHYLKINLFGKCSI